MKNITKNANIGEKKSSKTNSSDILLFINNEFRFPSFTLYLYNKLQLVFVVLMLIKPKNATNNKFSFS